MDELEPVRTFTLAKCLWDRIYSKREKSFCKQKKQTQRRECSHFFGTQRILLGPKNASYTRGGLCCSKFTGSWSFHSVLLVYFLSVTKWRASFSSTCDLISPLLTSSPHPSTGHTVATSEHCSVCEGIRYLKVHKIHSNIHAIAVAFFTRQKKKKISWQGMVFKVFCLERGVYFITFCLKQGIATWPDDLNRTNLDVCLVGFWRSKHISMRYK